MDHESNEDGLTRRHFIKCGAGAVLAASYLSTLNAPAIASIASQNVQTGTYICPPCGQPCDKLTFDRPGNCPQCGMKLIPLGGGHGSPPVVSVLIYDGAEIIDFAGPWEAFG